MSDALDLPDDFGEWPFEARASTLAAATTGTELRTEIDNIVGMPTGEYNDTDPFFFSKVEMAKIVLALGGPQGRRP